MITKLKLNFKKNTMKKIGKKCVCIYTAQANPISENQLAEQTLSVSKNSAKLLNVISIYYSLVVHSSRHAVEWRAESFSKKKKN